MTYVGITDWGYRKGMLSAGSSHKYMAVNESAVTSPFLLVISIVISEFKLSSWGFSSPYFSSKPFLELKITANISPKMLKFFSLKSMAFMLFMATRLLKEAGSLTCGYGSELTVAELAGSAEGLAFCETGPFPTEPSLVGLKGSRHTLEVPWQVPEGSCGCQAACQGAGKIKNTEEHDFGRASGHHCFPLAKHPKAFPFSSIKGIS